MSVLALLIRTLSFGLMAGLLVVALPLAFVSRCWSQIGHIIHRYTARTSANSVA